ncbi:MAG: exodeoxyribonuclease VII large subunit [Bacteroidales bacterium]|nr:exodeoxyribonuclease VII large subunit [Bacteroidales bacterium]
MQSEPLSLYELNQQIKGIIRNAAEPVYWVFAEISELKMNASGHCYLELVEKDEDTDSLKARSRATIWSSTYRMIRAYFESTTGIRLSPGMKVLVKVTIDFHEIYGLSLNITDIEPSYTIGEIARKKQEIINRLTEEGVIDMNRQLDFPKLPKKIAVISSETAAGFGDFKDQLLNNEYDFRFHLKLFPAYMQGEDTESSIIHALESINRYGDLFDVVVIIRGGGSQADLSCFDNYRIALHVAQFPLPVLTGIGHEKDETIVDMIAYRQLKTPTAVAEYIISCFADENENINELVNRILQLTRQKIKEESDHISEMGFRCSVNARQLLVRQNAGLLQERHNLAFLCRNSISERYLKVSNAMKDIRFSAWKKFQRDMHKTDAMKQLLLGISRTATGQLQHKLNVLENRNRYLSPVEILKRGYSITRQNGKIVRDGTLLHEGEILDTFFYKGRRSSRVVD